MIQIAVLDRLPRHPSMLRMSGERHRLREKRQGGTIPDTVCMKKRYRNAVLDYCRHHIIRAAVAVGVITEVKPGAGPVAVARRGAPSAKYDRPHRC